CSHTYQARSASPTSFLVYLMPNSVSGPPHLSTCSLPQHGQGMWKRILRDASSAALVIWHSPATPGVEPRIDFLKVAPSRRLSPRKVGEPSPSMSPSNLDSSS